MPSYLPDSWAQTLLEPPAASPPLQHPQPPQLLLPALLLLLLPWSRQPCHPPWVVLLWVPCTVAGSLLLLLLERRLALLLLVVPPWGREGPLGQQASWAWGPAGA
jgi:hypothetical protein